MHPTKASQHEFLATCIDVDLEKNVQHTQWQWSLPLWKGATMRTIPIQSNCPSNIAPSCASPSLQLRLLKNVTIYPPPPQPIHF